MNELRANAMVNDARGDVDAIVTTLSHVWGYPEDRVNWSDCRTFAETAAFHIKRLRARLDEVQAALEATPQ